MITPQRAALENRERQRIFLCQRPKVPLYIVPLFLAAAVRLAYRLPNGYTQPNQRQE